MIRRLMFTGLMLAVLGGCGDGASSPSASSQRPSSSAAADTQAANSSSPPSVPDDGKSVAARVESASTAARVKIALFKTPELSSFTFEPRVENKQLILHGDVATRAQREKAMDVAKGVEGVKAVRNQLLVAGHKVAAPEQIAEAESPPTEAAPDVQPTPAPSASKRKSPAKTDQETASEASQQASAEKSTKSEKSSAEYYTVKSGDSLWNIARNHDTSVSKLKRLNDMSSNSLHPGDKLRVR